MPEPWAALVRAHLSGEADGARLLQQLEPLVRLNALRFPPGYFLEQGDDPRRFRSLSHDVLMILQYRRIRRDPFCLRTPFETLLASDAPVEEQERTLRGWIRAFTRDALLGQIRANRRQHPDVWANQRLYDQIRVLLAANDLAPARGARRLGARRGLAETIDALRARGCVDLRVIVDELVACGATRHLWDLVNAASAVLGTRGVALQLREDQEAANDAMDAHQVRARLPVRPDPEGELALREAVLRAWRKLDTREQWLLSQVAGLGRTFRELRAARPEWYPNGEAVSRELRQIDRVFIGELEREFGPIQSRRFRPVDVAHGVWRLLATVADPEER
jgi:hypothetical protein